MAGIKEIRTHIKSVEQTLKITNAMYLISSSNMRKARGQLDNVVPYFEKIASTISDILHHSPELRHGYFDKRPARKGADRRVAFIVISGDKGLAGAYNHNVLKLAETSLADCPNPTLYVIGQVGRAYFTHKNIPIDAEFLYTAQNPTMFRAREIADTMLDLFKRERIDEVHVVYTQMVTPLRLEPRMLKLLPLDRDSFPYQPVHKEPYYQTVSYVPSRDAVISQIVPGYLRGMLFGAMVESYCSEQNARMTAMDASTRNAREMLKTLNLTYNRARQSAITQEITEIAGGAQRTL